jgi:TolB protein
MEQRVDRIAMVNLDGELEVVSPDGQSRQRLTSGDRVFHFPAWSPDARRIAAIGGNRHKAGVFIFDDAPDTEAVAAVHTAYESSRNAPIYLYWSPDGEHVSFIATRADEQSMGLHITSASKSAMKEGQRPTLVATGRPCFWDWTPDGKRILLHVGGWEGNRSAQLAMIDPFGANGVNRTSVARPGLFQSPGVASSGRYRAFGHVNRKNEMQLVIDPIADEVGEGRRRTTRIALRHEGVAAMSWSPVDDQLAFISPPEQVRTYYGPLRVMDAASGDVRVLSDDVVLAFFWSPDGRKIAYFTVAQVSESIRHLLPDPVEAARDGGYRAHRSAVDDNELGEIGTDEELDALEREADSGDQTGEVDSNAELDDAPDLWLNLWVVDVATGEDALIATFEPIDVFVNQFLPFFDQYAKSHRIWSPDSRALVLPMLRTDAERRKVPHITVVSADPAGPRPHSLAQGMMAFWSPR